MAKVEEIHYQLKEYEPNLKTPIETNIDNIIKGIENDKKEMYEQALVNFVVKESKNFVVSELQRADLREKLWSSLMKIANKKQGEKRLLADVFTVFRIISRDKASLPLVTEEWLNIIITNIGLNDTKFNYDDETLCKIEEGQKVLWNVLFQSPKQVEDVITNNVLDKVLERVKKYEKSHVPDTIKFYDMKLLFLVSAISTKVREKLQDLDALPYFITVLRQILKEAAENLDQSEFLPVVLDCKKANIACETLKGLFNITLDCDEDEQSIAKFNQLVTLLRDYLLASTASIDKTWQLRNDVVNLLTNIPAQCYEELMTPVDGCKTDLLKKLRFEDKNMIVVYELLMFLKMKLADQKTVSTQLEILSPILTVLHKGASTNRSIRKYLRLQILPPLKDVEKRPEDNDTLRGQLCKLLTTPITQIRDLVAELLFVLCKCNVNRMIKYTGYGNAAGLFAQRGLLGGRRDVGEDDFCSESDDSETEEYAGQKHLINPVLGCVEQPHPDPMAGMTDEQKEYEAMKLVNLFESMTRCGPIKPCRVGPDGKPQEIEHVLQLQEEIKDTISKKNDDSDSE